MSPELIKGEGASYPSDLWAVGVILYQLLAGKSPFEDKGAYQVYNNIVSGEVEYPEEFSPEAKDFISRILMRDPND